MARHINIHSDVNEGNIRGDVLELNNGDLVAHAYISGGDRFITKSTDGGATWTTKYTHVNGKNIALSLRYIAKNGSIYFGAKWIGEETVLKGYVLRSKDEGETWEKVLIGEGAGFWRMDEDSNGVLYTNEYGHISYNIWKSEDGGDTWSKWFSYPGPPGTINHVHTIFIDSNDNFYTSFGDPTWAPYNNTYKLNANGTLGDLISSEGNGWTAWVETASGKIFGGSDAPPDGVYEYHPLTNTYTQPLQINTEFGIGGYIYDLQVGKHGVIYALLDAYHTVFASIDDGVSWVRMDYAKDSTSSSTTAFALNVNINAPSGRLFISRNGNYYSFPDYTKAELLALYTSTLTIKTA